MPNNSRRKRWSGYVCSGTVTSDNVTGRSVIITASHCVYDDANNTAFSAVSTTDGDAGIAIDSCN